MLSGRLGCLWWLHAEPLTGAMSALALRGTSDGGKRLGAGHVSCAAKESERLRCTSGIEIPGTHSDAPQAARPHGSSRLLVREAASVILLQKSCTQQIG